MDKTDLGNQKLIFQSLNTFRVYIINFSCIIYHLTRRKNINVRYTQEA